MSKLQRLRNALTRKPVLLVDLMGDLRDDPPRIAGPWTQDHDGDWCRFDVTRRTIVFINHDHDHGTYSLEAGIHWPKAAKTSVFTGCPTTYAARAQADAILDANDFVLVGGQPHDPDMLVKPWKRSGAAWTRTQQHGPNRWTIAETNRNEWVFTEPASQVSQTFSTPELAKDHIDNFLRHQGWQLQDLSAGPWEELQDPTFGKSFIRKDHEGTTLLFVQQVKNDSPTPSIRGHWYITGSTGAPHLSKGIKALPISKTRLEAKDTADAFLRGYDYTLD